MTTDEFMALDDASKLALSRAALQGDVALQHALIDADREHARREAARREADRTAELCRINDSTGVISVIASSSTSANAPGAVGFTFATPGPSDSLPHQVVGDNSYFVRLFSSTGGALDKARGLEINYTRP